jgi:hypothetical protein
MTPMPPHLRPWLRILCSDCHAEADVRLHIVGLKCPNAACGGYNTRKVGLPKDEHPPDIEPVAPSVGAAGDAPQQVPAGGAGGDRLAQFTRQLTDMVGAQAAEGAVARIRAIPELFAMLDHQPELLLQLIVQLVMDGGLQLGEEGGGDDEDENAGGEGDEEEVADGEIVPPPVPAAGGEASSAAMPFSANGASASSAIPPVANPDDSAL